MSSTYATINNNLEDSVSLHLKPLAGACTADGESLVLFHEQPILSCDALTGWHDATTGENALVRFEREACWSYDNATYSDWTPLLPATLADAAPDPAFPLWVRFRYTRRGPSGVPVTLNGISVTGTRSFDSTQGVVTLDSAATVILRPEDVFKVFKLESVNVYVKNLTADTAVKGFFRYSGDAGRNWSPWTPLNDDNVRSTRFNTIRFSKFEFAFSKIGSGSPVVFDVELVGDFQNVSCANRSTARIGLKTQCAPGVSCAADGNPMNWRPSEKSCDTDNKYDPYKLGGAIGFQNYLANSVGRQWGHDVEYYRVDPDERGTDVLLHEHQLYNVVDMKELEASVPNNEFLPAADAKTGLFDAGLLSSFEVHITKDRFKQMFGLETRPGTNDIVYFCKINRLFVVERALAERTAFNTATYYRLALKNYNGKANVNKKTASQDIQDKLLAYTQNTTLDAVMGPQATSDQTKAANKQQFAPLSKITGITVSPQVTNKAYTLYNSTLVVSKSMYVLPVPMGTERVAVSYGHVDNELTKGDNRAISLWVNLGMRYDTAWSYNLFDNTENVFGYRLSLSGGKLRFTLNATEYALDAQDVEADTWYCVLVNVDQRMQQLEMVLYSRGAEKENAQKLRTAALMTRAASMQPLEPQAFTHLAEARLGVCTQPSRKRTEYYVTNVRLYNQVLQEDARDRVLNQHLVKDADLLILADNGEAKITVPEMGNNGN